MISVCIATYNGEKYIGEQLNSILSQLDNNDEVIISDDHSKDNTLNVIRDLGDVRIKIFNNEMENGYSKNFENAIKKASGDIIFICDQDDVWFDNKIQTMIEALYKAPLAIHNALIVDSQLDLINNSHFDLYQVKKGFLKNFLKTRYIGACMAFKREILQKALPFPQNQKLCAYDYWLTLIAEFYYKVELVKEPLIKYRRHLDNASTGGTKSNNSFMKKINMRIYSFYHLLKR
ncbi:glycosyltransferase [Flavobacterium piscis]|uniref:Glycosyltransferase involved in cell wall biosynthesis n=1 Tax=Flavobacterium piscis TaxID=1114874 RepID=A0ABU1Y4J8_9FLAO|nr:glycosyltransferase [Flavobacterium piscis]MDR7208983.1 glycosyltransferase involved in cell wall biosynthesis [Flavobacterium piscis]